MFWGNDSQYVSKARVFMAQINPTMKEVGRKQISKIMVEVLFLCVRADIEVQNMEQYIQSQLVCQIPNTNM